MRFLASWWIRYCIENNANDLPLRTMQMTLHKNNARRVRQEPSNSLQEILMKITPTQKMWLEGRSWCRDYIYLMIKKKSKNNVEFIVWVHCASGPWWYYLVYASEVLREPRHSYKSQVSWQWQVKFWNAKPCNGLAYIMNLILNIVKL